jgi:hypothetical protein
VGTVAQKVPKRQVVDDDSFDRWYAALHSGAAHGRVAPLVESAGALRGSLRSHAWPSPRPDPLA